MGQGAGSPEARARENIDSLLREAGWLIQDVQEANVRAGRGVAIREFPLKAGFGFADYLLYVDGAVAGVVEAKKAGTTLTGVEVQAAKYSEGLPDALPAHRRPLPFLYQSTGVETRFTNGMDPDPRSRQVFTFHRPETLAEWFTSAGYGRRAPSSDEPQIAALPRPVYEARATLRARLQHMPPLITEGLWPAQVKAITNLEDSLAEGRPRALIQMSGGSGKTFTACNFIYRLIKHAGARRVLFLVDRSNLGRQTLREFQQFMTPDDGRKFTEREVASHA